MPNEQNDFDQDAAKGAVEDHRPGDQTNTSLSGQLPHRTENRLVKDHDTDFPEPGGNPEHTGEPEATAITKEKPERDSVDQDPGERQKRNQAGREDDPLAA